MAKFTDEERLSKAKKIALYIISENEKGNKVSTRKLGRIFGVSNATVSYLMGDYLFIHFPNLYSQVNPIIKNNKPSINDEGIRKRVLEEAKLVVDGTLVSSMSDDSATLYRIYYDLNTLLPQIDEDLYNEVKQRLGNNSSVNLTLGNPDYILQERDESGRFKK